MVRRGCVNGAGSTSGLIGECWTARIGFGMATLCNGGLFHLVFSSLNPLKCKGYSRSWEGAVPVTQVDMEGAL